MTEGLIGSVPNPLRTSWLHLAPAKLPPRRCSRPFVVVFAKYTQCETLESIKAFPVALDVEEEMDKHSSQAAQELPSQLGGRGLLVLSTDTIARQRVIAAALVACSKVLSTWLDVHQGASTPEHLARWEA